MKDCVGNELNIGDYVVCASETRGALFLGHIVSFLTQDIMIEGVVSIHQKEEPYSTIKSPQEVHKVTYQYVAVKEEFLSDRADTPYIDYRCSRCRNDDGICEEDRFCCNCGAKFVTEKDLIQTALNQMNNSREV